MSEGRKDDQDKVRYELLPPELLESTATILTFGAKKYSKNYESEWQKLLHVQGVKRLKLTTQKGFVEVVMRDNCVNWTRSMQNDNVRIDDSGNFEILNESKNWRDFEKLIQSLEPETNKPNGPIIWQNLDLTKQGMPNFVREGVRYAERQNIYTLITVIEREDLEVSYVASATTVSECLEMTWLAWKERFNISKPLKINEGDRNWELGMKWSRPYGALMRHLWAWWNPYTPSVDAETGRSHLWHAACCLAFLIAYEERGIGEDDRPNANTRGN